MPRRPVQPVNQQAADAADEDLYSRHEDDPRPNTLYDADGNRRPFDPNAPGSRQLREEWTDAYAGHGGRVEDVPPTDREVDDAVEPCPYAQGNEPDIVIDFHHLDYLPGTGEDTVTLTTDDEDGPAYEQTHRLDDDAHVEELDDNYRRVTFTGIYPRRRYKLQVSPASAGEGQEAQPYYIFRGVVLPKQRERPSDEIETDTPDDDAQWREIFDGSEEAPTEDDMAFMFAEPEEEGEDDDEGDGSGEAAADQPPGGATEESPQP